ncbi:protein LTO1 homolog [Rhopilema esculentum]|uniref:protein LTO1 homolog n=1 Tax=Rhopilema esculentum TaxID=499914 RepID=UPI0031DCAA11
MAAKPQGDIRNADDIFDDIVLIEQKLHLDGYNEGYFEGQLVGDVEGFKLGVERGKAFGQEVGFYHGFCSTMLMLQDEDCGSQRLVKVLQQMKTKLLKMENKGLDPQDQSLFDDLETVRAKFKQVSSLMNATPQYGSAPATSDHAF